MRKEIKPLNLKFIVDNYESEISSELIDDILESDIDTTIENDGIGAYECWGFRGFDHGTNYLSINQQQDINLEIIINQTIVFEDDLKEVLNRLIEEMPSRSLSETVYRRGARSEDDGTDLEVNCYLKYEPKSLEIKNNILKVQLYWDENE